MDKARTRVVGLRYLVFPLEDLLISRHEVIIFDIDRRTIKELNINRRVIKELTSGHNIYWKP